MNTQQNLANRLFEFVRGNLSCLEAWGFYLVAPEFKSEVELRNRLGTLWFCGLLDHAEAGEKYVTQIIKDSQDQGLKNFSENAKQLKKLCTITGETLGLTTKEEQISLTQLRNQWVHGYLNGLHNSTVNVKYFENNQFTRETITQKEHNRILYNFIEKGNLDETLSNIMKRVIDPNLRYWIATGEIQRRSKEIYKILCSDGILKINI